MSQFNKSDKKSRKTSNYVGGEAFEKSLENEWTNMLFSFILQNGNNRFYESQEEYQNRYIELTSQMIEKYGEEFVGKAAVYSRNELGMRTISELTAAMLNDKQFSGKRKFYSNYFHRPDGVGEVFSAVEILNQKLSHGLVRGAKDYLETLNGYKLAKYKMKDKRFNMHDLINITHAYSKVIDRFQKGNLGSADTWENRISNSSTAEEKSENWKYLVENKKLGYLALIRNIRNILECDFVDLEWAEKYLVPQIKNETSIKKSLIFPYQIYTCWKISGASDYPIIESALSDAFKLACGNMQSFDGKSAIIVDVSGSMEHSFNANSSLSIKEVCCVYAAAFYISSNEKIDVYKFGNDAKKVDMPKKFVNVFKLIDNLQDNDDLGYATFISSVFNILDSHYDRLFVFSDMQVMEGNSARSYSKSKKSAKELFKEYQKEYGESHIYSFDLANYHTQLISDDSRIDYITALNDKVFDIINLIDNKKSLIDIIKQYTY